tara:strand:- start:15536 stop:15925 length:390 start_codon:yes stop_codon:yes gene_type:complete
MKKILIMMFIASSLLAEPRVYFIEPKNNQILTEREVTVKFGLEDFGVAPAGYDVPNTGHHHLLINVDLPTDLTYPIKADNNHIHFGLGQTETTITLPKGTHRLRLLMGNFLHIPHEEPIFSEEIIITVN